MTGSPHDDLRHLAATFVTLQEARQQAGYDHGYDINRSTALRLMVGAVKIARTRS